MLNMLKKIKMPYLVKLQFHERPPFTPIIFFKLKILFCFVFFSAAAYVMHEVENAFMNVKNVPTIHRYLMVTFDFYYY